MARSLPSLLLAGLLLAAPLSCAELRQVDSVAEKAASVVDDAGHALALLDVLASNYLDGLPAEADLKDAYAIVEAIGDARNALQQAVYDVKHGDLPSARDDVALAVLAMQSAASLLHSHGVDVTELQRDLTRLALALKAVQ